MAEMAAIAHPMVAAIPVLEAPNEAAKVSRMAHIKWVHEQIMQTAQVPKSREPRRGASTEAGSSTGEGVKGGAEVSQRSFFLVFIFYSCFPAQGEGVGDSGTRV